MTGEFWKRARQEKEPGGLGKEAFGCSGLSSVNLGGKGEEGRVWGARNAGIGRCIG